MVPIVAVIILEQSLSVIAACIPACMPYIRFQKIQRSWYPLSSRSRTKSKPAGIAIDAVSLREIKSERIGVHAASKGGPKVIFGKVSNPRQSPSVKHTKIPKNEFAHFQSARTDDYNQWPSSN